MEVVRKVWRVWKRVGQALGDLIGRVVLTVFYFTLFLPFGLGVRLLGDPLTIHPKHHAKWLDRTSRDLHIEDARRLS